MKFIELTVAGNGSKVAINASMISAVRPSLVTTGVTAVHIQGESDPWEVMGSKEEILSLIHNHEGVRT